MKSESSPLSELRAAGRPKWAAVVLRAAVTAGILGALLWWLPLDALRQALAELPLWLWLSALAGFAAGHVLSALKWRQLVRASGPLAGIGESLRAHALGLFANLCLPSIVGGDVLRAGIVIRRHGRPEAVALASITDRILDTLGLLAIAGVGALLIPSGTQSNGALGAVAALLLSAVAAAAVMLMALPRIPRERIPPQLASIFDKISAAASELAAKPAVAVGCLVLSLAIQTGFVALNATLGQAIGLSLPFAVWLLVWPLAKLVALVPVSLGGIGVREAALASLMLPFSIAPALAVAQSLIWESLLIALGLISGAVAFWFGRDRNAGAQKLSEGHA